MLSAKRLSAGPVATVVIVGGRAGGQIDVPQLLVRAHDRPDIRASAVLPRVIEPRIDTVFPAFRNRVKRPQQPSRAGIVPTHVSGQPLHRAPAVLHERPHHHDVADDNRRRVHTELKALDRPAKAFIAVRWRRISPRAFIVALGDDHSEMIRERLKRFLAGPWGAHFEQVEL